MTTSPDRPFVHVTDDDVTVTRTPTAEQARAIGLPAGALELRAVVVGRPGGAGAGQVGRTCCEGGDGVTRPFEARYGGRCAAECGQPIREGDQVVYEDDEIVHIDCEGNQEPQRPEHPACAACWTVHAGECM